MKRMITTTFGRALRGEIAVPVDVHFHADAQGRPYVCDVARCDSAALSVRELA